MPGHVLQHICAEHCANTVAEHCNADAIPYDRTADDDRAFPCTNTRPNDGRPVRVADVVADCRVLRGSH